MPPPVINITQPSVQSLMLRPAVNGNVLGTATGFIVRDSGRSFLITNWHVVSGRNPTSGQPSSTTGAVPDAIEVLHNSSGGLGQWVTTLEPLVDASGQPLWLEHPTRRRSCDVVALPLTLTQGVQLYPHVIEASPQISPRVAGGVSIVGFPFGITAGGALAVWSSGTLASEPDIDFANAPLMLVDSRTRPGQSGSPVILHSSGGGMFQMADGSTAITAGDVTLLLGVYSGRINDQSDLGMVWKVAALSEILHSGVRGNGNLSDPQAPAFPIGS